MLLYLFFTLVFVEPTTYIASMDGLLLPYALGLFSAVTVALANFFVKRGGDVLVTRMVLSVSMALAALPFAFITPLPPVALVPDLLLAVVVHWFYQFAMIRSLHRGDLSLVFPVMRGLAPLMTAILASIFIAEHQSTGGIAGLFIASLALLVFAIPPNRNSASRRPTASALGWAAATACGIGAYSVVDAQVARAMPETMTFVVWLFLLDWIGITIVTVAVRRGRILITVLPQLKSGIIGGVAGALSYAAAIFAFTLMDTATVTALRETSVIFAAILGALFLKEGFGARRIAAASVLAAGLIVMQLA